MCHKELRVVRSAGCKIVDGSGIEPALLVKRRSNPYCWCRWHDSQLSTNSPRRPLKPDAAGAYPTLLWEQYILSCLKWGI